MFDECRSSSLICGKAEINGKEGEESLKKKTTKKRERERSLKKKRDRERKRKREKRKKL